MKVTNYAEWIQAVNVEYVKLIELSYLLNENGQERLKVFGILVNHADFCATPEELRVSFHDDPASGYKALPLSTKGSGRKLQLTKAPLRRDPELLRARS